MDEDAPLSELDALKNSLADTQPVGHLVKCCRTMDQVSTIIIRGGWRIVMVGGSGDCDGWGVVVMLMYL